MVPLLYIQREINSGDEAIACYVSVETCQRISDPERAMPGICAAIKQFAKAFEVPIPMTDDAVPISMLSSILVNWSELINPKPLIVLFDEVDVLEGETLISFLHHLGNSSCFCDHFFRIIIYFQYPDGVFCVQFTCF